VKAECEEKYGPVVHIAVDPNTQGQIYVKFKDIPSGEKALAGLNGRFFGGRQVSASPVVEMVYTLK
jgi:RNA-binding protein 39